MPKRKDEIQLSKDIVDVFGMQASKDIMDVFREQVSIEQSRETALSLEEVFNYHEHSGDDRQIIDTQYGKSIDRTQELNFDF